MTDEKMRCRWGDGRGSSGEGNDMIAWEWEWLQEGAEKSEGIWWKDGEWRGEPET